MIIPQGEQISFFFEYDSKKIVFADEFYFANNFYMAAVTQQAEILFIKPTPEGGLTITPWGHEVPIFSQWRSEPICLGPMNPPISSSQQAAQHATLIKKTS